MLQSQYRNRYILFENWLVLDSDLDDRQLMKRLYSQYDYRDILLEYVCDPEPQLSVSAAGHFSKYIMARFSYVDISPGLPPEPIVTVKIYSIFSRIQTIDREI